MGDGIVSGEGGKGAKPESMPSNAGRKTKDKRDGDLGLGRDITEKKKKQRGSARPPFAGRLEGGHVAPHFAKPFCFSHCHKHPP